MPAEAIAAPAPTVVPTTNGKAEAKPDPKATPEAKPARSELDIEREESRRANAAARKIASDRDAATAARDEAVAKLKALEESSAAARKMAREDPAKAMQETLGITYAEATRILLAKGKGAATKAGTDAGLSPGVAAQLAELTKKLEARDAKDAERETASRAAHETQQTENAYKTLVSVAEAAGEKYELVAYEAKANPVLYRTYFRRFIDAEMKAGKDPSADEVLSAFEDELLTQAQKRAPIGKLRGLYGGAGSTTKQPAATKGTTATTDAPRTLTQEMTGESESATVKKTAAQLRDEESESSIARLAAVLRTKR